MQEKEAVGRGPGNDNMSLLKGLAQQSLVPMHPIQEASEGKQALQRILVVEDDPTLATLEAEILTAHGYLVVTVHSGELAITALRSAIPDLVVLDLELQGSIKGWKVLQMLRITTNIPVLLTTS